MAGIVVESPVERYLLFVHEEQDGVSSKEVRDAVQRSTRAPLALHCGCTMLPKPRVDWTNPSSSACGGCEARVLDLW